MEGAFRNSRSLGLLLGYLGPVQEGWVAPNLEGDQCPFRKVFSCCLGGFNLAVVLVAVGRGGGSLVAELQTNPRNGARLGSVGRLTGKTTFTLMQAATQVSQVSLEISTWNFNGVAISQK